MFDKHTLERDISDAISKYFIKRSNVTLSELKVHLISTKRLSEPYFAVTGDLKNFLEKNPRGTEVFALVANEDNELDPFVVPKNRIKVRDAKVAEPAISAPATQDPAPAAATTTPAAAPAPETPQS